MPYQCNWIAPKRVLLTTFSGVIQKDELHRFVAEIRHELSQGEPPIYHISNSMAMEKVQFSLKTLGELIRSLPALSGLSAQIDINHPRTLNTMLANVGGQLMRIETHTVGSLAEAVAMLKRIDRTLETVAWNLPADAVAVKPAG